MALTVGERIKQRREELGMTQDELAQLMGYSGRSSICKMETAGDLITTRKIRQFAQALHTTPAALMGWENPEFRPIVETLDKDDSDVERLIRLVKGMDSDSMARIIEYATMLKAYKRE